VGVVVASTRQDFDGLWSLYLAIGVAVAVLVLATVAFAVLRYRGDRVPSKRHEANALEIGAAVLISVIVALLVFRTFSTEASEDDSPTEAVRVDVTAFQWGWRFSYPGKGVSVVGNAHAQPTFAVPADRPVSFELTSADVIHAFWIPEERFKRSAIPGRVNRFEMEFESRGREQGLCSEFCGLLHSAMRFDVWVLSDERYERWLAAHR
jgi:cytochrome c oxidase subunit 2